MWMTIFEEVSYLVRGDACDEVYRRVCMMIAFVPGEGPWTTALLACAAARRPHLEGCGSTFLKAHPLPHPPAAPTGHHAPREAPPQGAGARGEAPFPMARRRVPQVTASAGCVRRAVEHGRAHASCRPQALEHLRPPPRPPRARRSPAAAAAARRSPSLPPRPRRTRRSRAGRSRRRPPAAGRRSHSNRRCLSAARRLRKYRITVPEGVDVPTAVPGSADLTFKMKKARPQ